MKNNNRQFALISFFVLLLIAGNSKMQAQTALATAPEKKADVAATPDELAKLRAAVETNPNDLTAHEAYIKATGFTKRDFTDEQEFVNQYENWMKKFPASPAVPYSLGHAYAGKESPKARPYLLKAVEIDPKYDKAYFDLWIDGERWGDFTASRNYLLKAKEAAPQNADYAFYYASGFSNTDLEKYKKLSLQVAADFPNTERGAQALYWLASRSDDAKEKISYYEQQRKDFPADKFSWTSSGMSEYFSLLLTTDANKALNLAQTMVELKGRDVKSWETNVSNAKIMLEAQTLLSAGKASEAVTVLDKLIVPRYSSSKEDIAYLKAKALDAAGNTAKAYENLLLYFAKEPTPKMNDVLNSYGKKLGKTTKKMDEEIWYIRDTASKKAPDFKMQRYLTEGFSSLSDYRGKVVMITYWFPGCGPCRGEFPHFEDVVKKFKGKDLVYLGINIVPEQDEYVVPFMKSSGYSFTPLKDNADWKKGPLDNRNAAPVNFLIDQDGQIIFSNFRTTEHNEEALEFMINSMLKRKKTS
jgi:thiol-disulfide isomerase/thioredoxin